MIDLEWAKPRRRRSTLLRLTGRLCKLERDEKMQAIRNNVQSNVEIWPGVQPDGRIPEGITTFRNFRSLSRETGIKLLLACPIAEKQAGVSVISWNKCTDFDRITKLLRGSGLDFKKLLAETERLVSQWWTEIELLKFELMHRRVLVGEEIIEAMTPWWD
jgi:hypothetical protein